MKAVVAEVSTDNLLRQVTEPPYSSSTHRADASRQTLKHPFPLQSSWFEHEAIVGLVFALKTYAAAMLALFISFWAALDEPRWAFLTVFIVSQPDSGLVLAKSFYRILGSVAGVIVTIALVFGLSQYGELFLASLAAWIAVCSFASRAERNFAAYAFQLAGYTAAIVGIPAALNRAGAYDLIVGRFTEISVGIACAALVSRLVFVRQLGPKLVALILWLTRRQDQFAAILLDPAADRERVAAERAQLVQDFVKIEAMRQSAFFESADARILGQRLGKLTDAAVELCVAAEAAATHRVGLVPDSPTPATAGPRISSLVRAADDRAISTARLRLQQCRAAFERGEDLTQPKHACRLWADPVPAAMAAMRSALAIGITSAIWFVTAWPDGPTAVVVAAVLCVLLAPIEQPDKIVVACAATILLSAVPVFVTQYHLISVAQDFPSLAVALAPLSLICAFIIAQPRIGVLGLLAIVYFEFASKIDNVMTYDVAEFLNSSLAILVGIGVAIVLFAALFPETPGFTCRRFRRLVVTHLRYLASTDRWQPALQSYQRALCEQLSEMLARLKDHPIAARDCFATGVTALSVAQGIGRLRNAMDKDALPAEIITVGSCLLERVARALRHASTAKFIKAAWVARSLRRRALAAMRAGAAPQTIEALTRVAVASETLRCDLMTARMLLHGGVNAFRS
jgi:uncharacterized membrane protein YccC